MIDILTRDPATLLFGIVIGAVFIAAVVALRDKTRR